MLFGCYCLNPRYVLDEKYSTNENDYPENFHKMIWGAIVNIAKKGNVKKITPIDIENEISQFDTAISLWKNNDGWGYIESAIDMSSDKTMNIGKYYDDVRKYSIVRNAAESLKMDISFLYDENDDEKLEAFNRLTSMDVLNAINNKFMDFKSMWKNRFSDNYSFKVGDGITNRLNEHKEQQNVYGYPFQSRYLTTVYRGMRPKKYILRSSVSGGGKTRNSHTDGDVGEKFGLEVMQALNDKCNKWKKEENIDYSLYGSPIESTTYKFAKCLKKRFGVVKGITNRDYITNSYHVPVFEKIDPFTKLSIESKFQKLSPGGAISYIECADLTHNTDAVLEVMQFIYNNIMYAELNTKSDYCQVCGYDGEIKIVDENNELIWECPNCGNRDKNKMNVARRTCGYIGSNFWNKGRTEEIAERYVHLDDHEYKEK